jgi:cytochrome c553
LPLTDLPELPGAPHAVVSSCARCHGADGGGRGLGAFPNLAGQGRDYVLSALDAYAEGRRHSGMMGPIAAALQPEERSELADYYSSLPPAPSSLSPSATEHERVRRGKAIATQGILAQGVPSCVDCHGPGGHPRNSAYPDLAGQYASYLVLQLELLQIGTRGGSPYAHIMRHVATRLTREQMRDVAAYFASLPAGGEETAR